MTFIPKQQGSCNDDLTVRRESMRCAWPVVLGGLLVAGALAAHFPAVSAGFFWDDHAFLTSNPLVKAPDGLHRYWFTTEAPDYFVLTSTMRWLEWRIWGDNPKPYHIGNILLHAVSAIILWRVLRRLGISELGAWSAALLFAVHPVTVASVAWITERKNVLSLLLCLSSILAYLRFDDHGDKRWYIIAVFFGAMALLAKTSVVMLPIVLLLMIWWKRNRITRRDCLRVAPFFAISLVLGLVEMWYEHHNAIGDAVVRPEGPASRIAAAGWIIWFYLGKIVLPTHLMIVYPRWEVDGRSVVAFVPLALLIGCLASFLLYRRSWGRGPLFALVCFLVVLTPVLGLVDMSFMRYSLVSDHLQYPAMPGIIALVAAVLSAPVSRGSRQPTGVKVACAAVICGVIGASAVLTWRQAQVFRDAEALWTQTITSNDRAWVAYNNRGAVLMARGDAGRAIRDFDKAIDLKPGYAEAFSNRGVAHANAGNLDLAMADFDRAVELNPRDAEACRNRAVGRVTKGELVPALADFTTVIELRPGDAEAYYLRSGVYDRLRDFEAAIQDLDQAIRLKPDYAEAYNNRGVIYNAKAEYDRAIADFTKVLELTPNDPDVYFSRGISFNGKKDHGGAIKDFTRVLQLKPDDAEACNNRGMAYCFLKAYDKAWADVRACRRLGGVPSPELIQALVEATGQAE
jgi:protein O-mannosyl-transferase